MPPSYPQPGVWLATPSPVSKFFVPYAIPTDAYQGDLHFGSDNGFARERQLSDNWNIDANGRGGRALRGHCGRAPAIGTLLHEPCEAVFSTPTPCVGCFSAHQNPL